MKVLYCDGGHGLQSADDCRMLADLGVEWYSTGYYAKENGSGDLPKIYPFYGSEDFYKKLYLNPYVKPETNTLLVLQKKNITYGGFCPPNIWQFNEDFIKQFDIVIFNHNIQNLINNYHHRINNDKIKFIIKTFGMHDVRDEQKIGVMRCSGGIYTIRNNPTECLRSNLYAGHDAIIRGSVVKDENEISGWKGNKPQIITFSNSFNFKQKDNYRRQYYCEIRNNCGYNFRLFGSNNEDEPLSDKFLKHKDKVKILRESRINLVVGTPGSSNTYSLVEALVMGMPIVVFGKQMWQSPIYEIDQIITNGVHGFIVDNTSDAIQKINMLMEDFELCEFLSKNARSRGVELFGRINLIPKWKKVLFKEVWKDKKDRKIIL